MFNERGATRRRIRWRSPREKSICIIKQDSFNVIIGLQIISRNGKQGGKTKQLCSDMNTTLTHGSVLTLQVVVIKACDPGLR